MTFHSLKQHVVFLAIVVAAVAIYGVLVYHHYSKSDMVSHVAPSGNGTSAVTVSIDGSGNLSIGSSVYGPNSATVNGDVTVGGSTWSGSSATEEPNGRECHTEPSMKVIPTVVGKAIINTVQTTSVIVCD